MSNVICFHNPVEVNGYLSNWYLSNFTVDGVQFTSMEQYMMYKKADLFHDKDAASQILNTSNVRQIKAIGRSVKNYNDVLWNGMRQIIVYQGLLEKFKQNKTLRQQLIKTHPHLLAECAVQDRIWGIGLSMRDDRRLHIEEWRGQNLLGFSLMMVREALQDI